MHPLIIGGAVGLGLALIEQLMKGKKDGPNGGNSDGGSDHGKQNQDVKRRSGDRIVINNIYPKEFKGHGKKEIGSGEGAPETKTKEKEKVEDGNSDS